MYIPFFICYILIFCVLIIYSFKGKCRLSHSLNFQGQFLDFTLKKVEKQATFDGKHHCRNRGKKATSDGSCSRRLNSVGSRSQEICIFLFGYWLLVSAERSNDRITQYWSVCLLIHYADIEYLYRDYNFI